MTPAMQIAAGSARGPFNTETLCQIAKLEIIVEFPDGYQRALTRTTLYVDGVVMDENTSRPFNEFRPGY
ncbi:MAG: hypothetical protein IPG44_11690 [Anaerolineales bacterium]|nr:hypothetical protein [Anaerolineales bacterium]